MILICRSHQRSLHAKRLIGLGLRFDDSFIRQGSGTAAESDTIQRRMPTEHFNVIVSEPVWRSMTALTLQAFKKRGKKRTPHARARSLWTPSRDVQDKAIETPTFSQEPSTYRYWASPTICVVARFFLRCVKRPGQDDGL